MKVDQTESTLEHRANPAIRSFLVIGGLLVLGVTLNLVWNLAAPENRSGLRGHADNALATLVIAEQPTLRSDYGFVAHLHDLARGGTIAVPDEGRVDPVRVANLAQVSIAIASYEPTLSRERFAALAPGLEVRGEGVVAPGGPVVAYRFLMLDDRLSPSVTYFETESEIVIVDDRLGTP